MPLRQIEIYHQRGKADDIAFLLKDTPVLQVWHIELSEGETVTKVLLQAKNTESVLDIFHSFYSEDRNFRVVILPVEATIPRPEAPTAEEKEEEPGKTKVPDRISTEEVYQKMTKVSGLSQRYILMAGLAAVVASIGLIKNDVAVIIGSMVIAPLLSPNMALALAATLADFELAKRSIITNIAGFSITLIIGISMGYFLSVDPDIPQIAARSDISYYYIFIALATGVAGAYSITSGISKELVGVMVAVALLPPLVAAGLLFGGQYWQHGTGAILLFFVNVVCINLSGIVTFKFQGIEPRGWWEAKKAKRSAAVAIVIWFSLLLLLAAMIFFEQKLPL
jgi:uncharacterized hydrophobic protein (TIGR00341 family)